MKLQTREESQVVPKLPLTWSEDEHRAEDVSQAEETPCLASEEVTDVQEEIRVAESEQAAAVENAAVAEAMTADAVPQNEADANVEGEAEVQDTVKEEASQVMQETPQETVTPVVKEEIIAVENFGETVGAELHRIRADLKLRVADVATKVRVTSTFIRDLEHDNFENLPPLDMCEERIEKLCFVYDVNPEKLLERFSEEYSKALAETPVSIEEINEARTQNGKYYRRSLADAELPKAYRNTPSILIMILIVAIAGLLAYAFISYMSHRPAERLKVELMDYIPTPQPKILPLDGGK